VNTGNEDKLAQWAGRMQRAAEAADGGAPKKKLGYALKGDPYQPSHVHAMALRHTGKEILKDLWLACGPVPEHLQGAHHLRTGQFHPDGRRVQPGD
jgi:hypothetical protein